MIDQANVPTEEELTMGKGWETDKEMKPSVVELALEYIHAELTKLEVSHE